MLQRRKAAKNAVELTPPELGETPEVGEDLTPLKPSSPKEKSVIISPPKLRTGVILIEGTSPLVINKMSARQRAKMKADQEAGSVAKSKRKREPKVFEGLHLESAHFSDTKPSWYGIPASAFRTAMIDACRLVGFQMTRAKMSIFVEPDGFDRDDGQALVKIIGGEPLPLEMTVRLKNGSTDINVRPQWRKWSAKVRVIWDADQFNESDVVNLMWRVGTQVGIGAGRHFSKETVGLGFGCFKVLGGVPESSKPDVSSNGRGGRGRSRH